MNDERLDILSSFRSLILLDMPFGGDAMKGHLEYLFSDFSIAGMPNFETFGDILKNIDHNSEVCEGVGFLAYKAKIRECLQTCFENGKTTSILLPLKYGEDSHNFLMKVKKNGHGLSILLFLLNKDGYIDLDTYAAGKFKDRLTGLFNFNTFKTHLEADKTPGFICLFDLNKFKEINDTYGHSVGDDVLLLISSFMISISSQDEIFYRRSGDEFLIYVLKNDLKYAMGLINSMEAYLHNIPKVSLKQYDGLSVSASYGLLEIHGSNDKNELSLDDKLKLLDLAMYQAKKSGKLCHYISYEDSLNIVAKGDLDKRLQSLAASIKR